MPPLNPYKPLAGPGLAMGSMISVQLGSAVALPIMLANGSVRTTALRLACAALVLLALTRPRFGQIGFRQWRIVIALGLVMAWMTLCFFAAMTRIPLGVATAIDFLGPLTVAIVALRGWPRLALPLVAGIGILAMSHAGGGWLFDPIGMLLALGAGAGWAGYIVLTRQVGQLFQQQDGLCLSLLIAALFALPIAFMIDPSRLSRGQFSAAAALAILVPLLPYSLEMIALRRMSMGAFSILMSLEPAIGALFGWLILGQILSARQAFGILAVMAASSLAILLGASTKGRSRESAANAACRGRVQSSGPGESHLHRPDIESCMR